MTSPHLSLTKDLYFSFLDILVFPSLLNMVTDYTFNQEKKMLTLFKIGIKQMEKSIREHDGVINTAFHTLSGANSFHLSQSQPLLITVTHICHRTWHRVLNQ